MAGAACWLALVAPSLAATGDTASWDSPGNGNPILPGYYADPSVVEHEGRHFLYATLDPWGGESLGCWETPDFRTWTFHTLNWPTKAACTSPTSKGAMVWAPSVVKASNGSYYMYVSVGSEVWVGVAEQPLGPWKDALGGRPLIPASWNTKYHMIDAECFIDTDGQAYLYWGSGWNWVNGRCFAVRLRPDMITFDGEVRDVTPENGHYFEGPLMLKAHGRYYLMYSAGKTVSDTYAVHYAVGDSPLGPFVEPKPEPILRTDHARNIVSPGHHTVLHRDGEAYILYHRHRVPYEEGKAFRQICLDRLRFAADGTLETVRATHAGPEWLRDPRDAPALAATATASSSESGPFGPEKALDRNYATRWATGPRAGEVWLQLDLGSAQPLRESEVIFEYAWKPCAVALLGSVDGQTWQTLADHRAKGLLGSPVRFGHEGSWRYLRLAFAPGMSRSTISVFEWNVIPAGQE